MSVSDAGKDGSGVLTGLYTFGGRSYSVRRASDMALVYDSGDDIGRITEYYLKGIFNANMDDPTNRPFEDMDERSVDKVHASNFLHRKK